MRKPESRMANDEYPCPKTLLLCRMKHPGFDLEERTAALGEAVIEFCLGLPFNPVAAPVISQLVRAATSIGANYCEADDAESKKDFRHKIALCRKESRETKYWCRMIAKAVPAENPLRERFGGKPRSLISFSHASFEPPIRTCAPPLYELFIRHSDFVILSKPC
jgi:four helix bundle protein